MFHNPNQNNNNNAGGSVAVAPDSVGYQCQNRTNTQLRKCCSIDFGLDLLNNDHQNDNVAQNNLPNDDQQMEDYISDLFDVKMRLFVDDESLEEGIFEMDEDCLSMETDAGEDGEVGSDLQVSGLAQAFFQGNEHDEWSIQGYQMDGLLFPAYNQEEDSSNALVRDSNCIRGYSRQWRLSLATIPEE